MFIDFSHRGNCTKTVKELMIKFCSEFVRNAEPLKFSFFFTNIVSKEVEEKSYEHFYKYCLSDVNYSLGRMENFKPRSIITPDREVLMYWKSAGLPYGSRIRQGTNIRFFINKENRTCILIQFNVVGSEQVCDQFLFEHSLRFHVDELIV